jgi:hypothetical protein
MADVQVPYIGGPLDGDAATLDEATLTEGRIFDYRPAVLDEDADPDEGHRYQLRRRDADHPSRPWEYHIMPAPRASGYRQGLGSSPLHMIDVGRP